MNKIFLEIQSITIIGKGNVAWLYNDIMTKNGFVVNCISSRKEIRNEYLEVDLIIIAVSDKAIEEVVSKFKLENTILVHTSGTMDMGILINNAKNYGVFYPLQTISKAIEVDFSNIPLCIEGNNEKTFSLLSNLANKLSKKVYKISSDQRKEIHIAAVFANNFTNHLFGIAKQELGKKDIPFEILFPLIDQTIAKIKTNNPFEVQTGPAKRNDIPVMEKHKLRLGEDEREIYKLLSEKIIKKNQEL
ncbi:MAG TPA: DUF2520 domain-containing protein [Bacteroidales bacterium]|nr:DUF2520 domain-containing protein [Bacteroidales bacterium]